MKVKERFELVESNGSGVYNILPVGESVISGLELSYEESIYIRALVKMYANTKNVPVPNFVLKNLETCKYCKIPTYTLETTCTQKFTPIVNIMEKTIADITPQNAYALTLNALALSKFFRVKPFSDSFSNIVAIYIYAIFMKLYGKKSGLMGSYTHLMPKLKFLCYLYSFCGLFGLEDTIKVRNTIAVKLFMNPEEVILENIDMSTTKGFLDALRINEIIPTSLYKFSTSIINMSGVSSLPIFEDLSRLHANLLSSLVPSSSVFSNNWVRIPGEAPTKIVKNAIDAIERYR